MKVILSILLLSCLLGLGSTLTCAHDKIEAINNSGTAICVTEIPNCAKYNDSDSTKCHVCFGNSIPAGTGPNFTACDCSGKPTIVVDEKGLKTCIATGNVVNNCAKYNSGNLTKCYTCFTGAAASGQSKAGNDYTTCDCTKKSNVVKDENDLPTCVTTLIAKCHRYSSTNPTVCHTCFNGSTSSGSANAFSSCDCTTASKSTDVVDNAGIQSCITPASVIANCLVYNKDDLTKCQSCIQNADLTGSSPNISACACTGGKTIKQNEDGVNVCVSTVIADCLKYNDGDLTKCQTCAPGFGYGGAASPDATSCTCDGPKKKTVDENGASVCVTEIANCQKYNSADLSKCHTCNTGTTTPGGDTANLYTSCTCDSATKQVGVDDNGDAICAPKMDNCKIFKNTSDTFNTCHTCIPGSTAQGPSNAHTSCVCDSSANKFVRPDQADEASCVTIMKGCHKYRTADLTQCHTCHSDFTGVGSPVNQFTSCGCTTSSKTAVVTNTDAFQCVDPVDNCQVYNNSNKGKCYTCKTTFDGTGTSNQYTACACSGSKQEKTNNLNVKVCAEPISGCDKYLSTSLDKCHTCDADTIPQGPPNNHTGCTACNSPKIVADDNASAKQCVDVIVGCTVYNKDSLDKCYTCHADFTGAGTPNQFTACNCTGGKVAKKDNLGAERCVAVMAGCDKYLSSNLTQCHTCNEDTVPQGTINAHTGCTACASPKKVKVDNTGAKVCVAVIEGCAQYKSSDNTKCHACGTGFTGVGSANTFTSCTCTNSAQVNELGTPVCVVEIENCLKYSSSSAGKCHTCFEGFTGTGGAANARTACPCTGGSKAIATKADSSKICIDAAIAFCTNYKTTTTCDNCVASFTKNSGETACECASPKAAKKTDSDADICVDKVIEKCSKYASATTCHTCESGNTPSADKSKCEAKETPTTPASSGSVLSFAMTLLLVLVALA